MKINSIKIKITVWILAAAMVLNGSMAYVEGLPPVPPPVPPNRIASIYISENLINELISQYLKTPLLRDVVVNLDPENDQVVAHGLLRIPADEIRALNIEKRAGDFKFQLVIKLKITTQGHLIIIFPLDQTYFYPANSTNPDRERVIIPVQFLSLALASARGYLAAMSGDFSGFNRQTEKLNGQIAEIQSQILSTKDMDEREALQNDRKSLELQLEAIPIQRKQSERIAKKLGGILGFVGENEINLNQELSAHKNALILRIKVGQLAPYLEGIELGGVRILRDKTDGEGMNFMAIDINAPLVDVRLPTGALHHSARVPSLHPPEIVVRLNQSLLESRTIVGAEQKDIGSRIKDFSLNLEEDGIHVSGKWHVPFLPGIPFNAIVDFVWVAPNVFEIRVREIEVLHVDLEVLTGIVLDSAKNRLNKALKGACTFEYVGVKGDHSRAVRATINMATLLPAFPGMVLSGIVVKDRELLLKAGKP